MVKLTEEMVKNRTRKKQCDIKDLKEFNCWGSGVSDVSIASKMVTIEVLALSSNNINTLKYFKSCHNLRELYLRDNQIKDLSELKHIKNLSNLRVLSLIENPCCDNAGPNYRRKVLEVLPKLKKLDNQDVFPCEIQDAMMEKHHHQEGQQSDYDNSIESESDPPTPCVLSKNVHEHERYRTPSSKTIAPERYSTPSSQTIAPERYCTPSSQTIAPELYTLRPLKTARERRTPHFIDDQYVPRQYNRASNTNVNMDLHLYSNAGANNPRMPDHCLKNEYIPPPVYENPYLMRKQFNPLALPPPGFPPNKLTRSMYFAFSAIFKELDYDGLKVLDDAIHQQMDELAKLDEYRRLGL